VVLVSVSVYLFLEVNPVVLVVMGIFAGLAIGSCYERKGAEKL
jgi:hypothetical protein